MGIEGPDKLCVKQQIYKAIELLLLLPNLLLIKAKIATVQIRYLTVHLITKRVDNETLPTGELNIMWVYDKPVDSGYIRFH